MASESRQPQDASACAIGPSLWPVCLLAGVMVMLNGAAWLDWPLAVVFPWVYAVLAISTLTFFLQLVRADRALDSLLPVILGAICAWIAVSDAAGFLFTRSFVSAHPDAWSYDCIAGYLADYGRTQLSGMSLVDQFGSHLRDSRFSASCLLALGKSMLGPSNPFGVHSLFYLSILTVTYCSVVALARQLGLKQIWAHVTAASYILIGWSTNALIIGNYDNLCFSALFPGALALLLQLIDTTRRWLWIALNLGMVTAALLYTYPEGTALCGPTVIPLFVWFLAKSSAPDRRRILGRLLSASAMAIVLWLPYAPGFLRFLGSQLVVESDPANRPGSGNFPGLLSDHFPSSILALGSEYPDGQLPVLTAALAVLLGSLIMLGLVNLYRQHAWIVWSAAVTGMLIVWQALMKQYDYGVYKVIYCHAWVFVPALASGAHFCSSRLPRKIAVIASIGLILGIILAREDNRANRVWPLTSSLTDIAELTTTAHFTDGAPILVDIPDIFDQMWALTVLRDQPVVVAKRTGYLAMPHVQSNLDRGRFVSFNQPEIFILNSQSEPDSIWHNERFTLSRRKGAIISRTDNPNGVETVEGKPFVWIAHDQATGLHVFAVHEGIYFLTAAAWWLGPSRPEDTTRTLKLTDAEGTKILPLDFSAILIPVYLEAGENLVHLQVVEPPTVLVHPNGDQRELMLGMLGYSLKTATD